MGDRSPRPSSPNPPWSRRTTRYRPSAVETRLRITSDASEPTTQPIHSRATSKKSHRVAWYCPLYGRNMSRVNRDKFDLQALKAEACRRAARAGMVPCPELDCDRPQPRFNVVRHVLYALGSLFFSNSPLLLASCLCTDLVILLFNCLW